MNIEYFPKEILKICVSYLSPDEAIYYGKDWKKFPKDKVCNISAKNSWLDLLKWARKYKCIFPWNKCPWNERVCAYAAENNNFEMLKWAHENGCPWDSNT